MTETPEAGVRPAPASARAQPPFAEFVALVGALMALNAVAIDVMLPALGVMGEALHAARANDQQLVIVVYMLAFGPGQLIYGPISDRFGRRPTLMAALALYIAGSIVSVAAANFELLLAARVVQGLGAAATRVVTVSVVRDLHEGRSMARVMSFAMMIFMAAPILAPALGAGILFTAGWRAIFVVLLIAGAACLVWIYFRLPESLSPSRRKSADPRAILKTYAGIARQREPMIYMAASGLLFGGLIAFISSANQIFSETYPLGAYFPLAFAGVAGGLAVSSFANATLVERIGMRPLSHAALIAYAVIATAHAGLALLGYQPLAVFLGCTGVLVFTIGFLGSNFTAIAMQPLGDVAGAGSSMQGFVSTMLGAVSGGIIARFYDGSAAPIAIGSALCGLAALALVLGHEREHFLQPTQRGARS